MGNLRLDISNGAPYSTLRRLLIFIIVILYNGHARSFKYIISKLNFIYSFSSHTHLSVGVSTLHIRFSSFASEVQVRVIRRNHRLWFHRRMRRGVYQTLDFKFQILSSVHRFETSLTYLNTTLEIKHWIHRVRPIRVTNQA